MRRFLSISLFFVFLSIGGCATEPVKPLFTEVAGQHLPSPPSDKAQIVFLEPINDIQGLIPVGLYELENDRRTLLAITGSRSKTALLFEPGHHRLMANQAGLIAHFLDIDVEAGKRYYVLLRFIYSRGFQLRPLRTSGPSDYSIRAKDFSSWIANTRVVEKTPAGVAYFHQIDDAVAKSQAEAWKDWLKKSDKERAELTLVPQDAVAE